MLKKILLVLAVVLTLGFVVFALWYLGILDFNKVKPGNVAIMKDDYGRTYTERRWYWKPKEYRGMVTYLPDSSGLLTTSVPLLLHDDTYYNVEIPADSEYIWDMGKSIFAEDGSWQVKVVGNATLDNISSLAGVDQSEALTRNVLQSPTSKKGSKTVATVIDGCGIICTIYEGDAAYTIMRNSLVSNQSPYEIDSVQYADEIRYINTLSYSGQYVAQVQYTEVNLSIDEYLFADGSLYVLSDLENIKATRERYLKQLNVMSGAKIESLYDKDGIVYAQAGDCFIGLISYNSNTTIVAIGQGEEARCNILSLLISMR